nr:MAG TPA: hypothetical protein [Caudoviricetes sp.]
MSNHPNAVTRQCQGVMTMFLDIPLRLSVVIFCNWQWNTLQYTIIF